jgi:prepilin-type N-terminal cleavage/methylation domain-containing protein
MGETKPNNGFTLIEILLVMTILGIALTLAGVNFSKGYSRFQLNRTMDDLLSISRWAQAMAIGQQRIFALSFSRNRRSYDLVRAADNEDSSGQEDFEPVKGSLGRMHTIPETIRLESPDDRVEFYPDGTIGPAAIQLISPNQKKILSSTQVCGMMTKVENE